MKDGPISPYRPPSVATAAATIKFTPSLHFTSQKNNDRDDDGDDLSPSIPKSSLLNENSRDSEDQKQITLYFVNTGDKFEFMRVVDP